MVLQWKPKEKGICLKIEFNVPDLRQPARAKTFRHATL